MRSEEDYGCVVRDVDVILHLCVSVCVGGWASEGEQRSQPLVFSHFCIRAAQSIHIHTHHIHNSVHASCRSDHASSLYVVVTSSIAAVMEMHKHEDKLNSREFAGAKRIPSLSLFSAPLNAS
jgi:hypothetical protein